MTIHELINLLKAHKGITKVEVDTNVNNEGGITERENGEISLGSSNSYTLLEFLGILSSYDEDAIVVIPVDEDEETDGVQYEETEEQYVEFEDSGVVTIC